MKKTNVALLHNVRLAKVLPLFFAFFVVSAVQLSALDLLPFEEGFEALYVELEETKSDAWPSTNDAAIQQPYASQEQSQFNVRYFTQYGRFAKQTRNLEESLELLDAQYDPNDPKPDVRERIAVAREALLDIITE